LDFAAVSLADSDAVCHPKSSPENSYFHMDIQWVIRKALARISSAPDELIQQPFSARD
jgi:hypothetical protein